MKWDHGDVRRVAGMLSIGVSMRSALVELNLGVFDLVVNVKAMTRPKVIDAVVDLYEGLRTFAEEGELPVRDRGSYKIDQLRSAQCRYPMGQNAEGSYLFCGGSVPEKGKPWCAEHRLIVYTPSRPKVYKTSSIPA